MTITRQSLRLAASQQQSMSSMIAKTKLQSLLLQIEKKEVLGANSPSLNAGDSALICRNRQGFKIAPIGVLTN